MIMWHEELWWWCDHINDVTWGFLKMINIMVVVIVMAWVLLLLLMTTTMMMMMMMMMRMMISSCWWSKCDMRSDNDDDGGDYRSSLGFLPVNCVLVELCPFYFVNFIKMMVSLDFFPLRLRYFTQIWGRVFSSLSWFLKNWKFIFMRIT